MSQRETSDVPKNQDPIVCRRRHSQSPV